MEAHKNIIERYVSAWNNHDPIEIEKCFDADGIYIDANLDQEIPSSQFSQRAKELFNYFPKLQVKIDQQTSNGDNLTTIHWTLSGTLPNVELHGLDVFCIREEKIQSLQVYFNYETGRLFAKVPSLHLKYQPDQKTQSQADQTNSTNKYATSGLTTEDIKRLTTSLESLMKDKKIYLQDDLTLSMLASILDTTTNHLSQVINSTYSRNFYDFVNGYRIEYAKKLMAQKLNQDTPILDVLLESGFKSSSTFYNAFKKETGLTPTQFKKSLMDCIA